MNFFLMPFLLYMYIFKLKQILFNKLENLA